MKALISVPPTRSSALEKAMFAMTRNEAFPRNNRPDMVYADDKLVAAIVERGAAPIATTTGAGFAAELVQNLVGDFIGTLAPLSAAAAIISRGVSVPMPGAGRLSIPAREGAPSTAVAWVGEGQPIPVRVYQLNDDTVLSPRKFGFIVGVSRELAKRANGEGVIRQLMREDAAATLDGAYFSTAAGDATTHPGMLNGVTAGTGFAGGDRTAIEADLSTLSDAVAANGSGEVIFVTSPKRAARFKIIAPEISREVTMLPSLAVADDRILAVDPLSWAHGFGTDFDIDASEGAVMHMSDDPDPIVDGSAADPVRSMWQTASLALRLIGDVAFAARRPNAVAYVDGVTW